MSIRNGRAAIEVVAAALDEIREHAMFLGVAAVGLLVTNFGGSLPRLTDDVDVVVDIATFNAYVQLHARLRELGFVEDASPGAPMCRWLIRGIKVDVMSSGATPGPTNRWYAEAMANAQSFALNPRLSIRLISAPYFIADKLGTFADGRRGDHFSSHDLEDIVAVIDGRPTIEADVDAAPSTVRGFLRERFRLLLGHPALAEVIAGHLSGDSASQARLPLVLARMRAIAA